MKELCRKHGFSDASCYLWRRRFGYRRLHIMLEREGFEANHKRVQRLYRQAGLGFVAAESASGWRWNASLW